MKLGDIKAPKGANKERKRVGRGHGSGHVKTAGRGQKGQNSRTGGGAPARFEGGQTPIQQQLPYKRGFTNIRRVEFAEVNVDRLGDFEAGAEVTPQALMEAGLVRGGNKRPIALLGRGEIAQALTIKVHRASKSAIAKVEAAGGKVEILEG